MKRLIPYVIGAALLIPALASAATFDLACAPETEHNPTILAPNLAFMLDQSGSMANDSSEVGKSRWVAATEAINETVQAFTTAPVSPAPLGACTGATDLNCDKVRFGLALFSESAIFPVSVGEDTATQIESSLAANGPTFGTAMGLAAQTLEVEATLNDPTRTNHAVFVTDGLPHVGCDFLPNRDTLIDAVIALCNASTRANPLNTNVIGFGGGTNEQVISLLAAAGGTGSCHDTTDPTRTLDICGMSAAEIAVFIEDVPYIAIDPITAAEELCHESFPDPSIITCTGGIESNSNSELKDAISGIVTGASCTFPLEIPGGYPDGNAQADADFTKVEISHSIYGSIPVDNIGDCNAPSGSPSVLPLPEFDNEGWCFTNNRRGIQLTAKLCRDIGARQVDKVVTQVACICPLTGQPCSLTDLMCGGELCTNEQLLNMPCSAGQYACVGFLDVCQANGAMALPEICNGVDDNCDGSVDNLRKAEPDWDKSEFVSFKDTTALHCEFENVCGCEGGAKARPTIRGGVPQLIADAIPECVCKSSLEFEENLMSFDQNDTKQDSSAACSALSNDPTGLLYVLIPIALIGIVRRRRKT